MTTPLVSFNHLSVSFAGERSRVRAVQEVSFTIQAGQTVGVVGESGCGKSVTAMALMGLLPPQTARIDGGDELDAQVTPVAQVQGRLERTGLERRPGRDAGIGTVVDAEHAHGPRAIRSGPGHRGRVLRRAERVLDASEDLRTVYGRGPWVTVRGRHSRPSLVSCA